MLSNGKGLLAAFTWTRDKQWDEVRMDKIPYETEPSVHLILLDRADLYTHLNHLTDRLQLNTACLTEFCQNSNGYFGSETDSKGIFHTWCYFEIKHVETTLEYVWKKINVLTRYEPSKGQATIVLSSNVFTRINDISGLAELSSDQVSDPFWLYALILSEVVRLEDKAVWSIRNHVRTKEKAPSQGVPHPNYRKLHDVARHAIHVSETLDVTLCTLSHMLTSHASQTPTPQIASSLAFSSSLLASLKHRALSNEKRLQNEIQLEFNMVAHYNAGLTLDIGRATQSDSSSMKTIAFVTLMFLPPTFISAVFSTSFFDFGEDGWIMSDDFWVYWAFAVPLTLAAVGWWYIWQRVPVRELPSRQLTVELV